tara:strand:+ start:389 stop:562 length:174 start_codon:yes stop_codon:yes gene_type:complete
MKDKKLKKAIGSVLQYGWMWGNPKHISKEHWELLHESYKELNNGKEFKPDETKKAKA